MLVSGRVSIRNPPLSWRMKDLKSLNLSEKKRTSLSPPPPKTVETALLKGRQEVETAPYQTRKVKTPENSRFSVVGSCPGLFKRDRKTEWATKKTLLLSMKSWLVNRDPYNGLLKKSLYNWVVHHPLYNPTNQGPFFHCSNETNISHIHQAQSFHVLLATESYPRLHLREGIFIKLWPTIYISK